MQALSNLGIDLEVMIAQAVNFAIVLGFLSYFLYQPVLKILEKRKQRIAESLLQADTIEQKLAHTNDAVAKQLDEAKAQATAIIEQAKQEAQTQRTAILADAEQQVTLLKEQANKKIAQDQVRMTQNLRNQALDLSLTIIKKLLTKNADQISQQHIQQEINTLK